jgi:hypothetical protein
MPSGCIKGKYIMTMKNIDETNARRGAGCRSLSGQYRPKPTVSKKASGSFLEKRTKKLFD